MTVVSTRPGAQQADVVALQRALCDQVRDASVTSHRRLSHSLVAIRHPGMTTNAGGTTVLEKIVYTSVFVSDQDRALDFYTNVLGFEQRAENPTPDGPRFLTVGVQRQDFELVLWPGTPGQGQPVDGRIPAAYTIETGDIRNAFEELKSRGVKFDTEVLEYPWGYVAVFQDPDGNRLQLREVR
jgi:catechol 2,3-dioxygenase-like lactoylglutathione lyase family enzyme